MISTSFRPSLHFSGGTKRKHDDKNAAPESRQMLSPAAAKEAKGEQTFVRSTTPHPDTGRTLTNQGEMKTKDSGPSLDTKA